MVPGLESGPGTVVGIEAVVDQSLVDIVVGQLVDTVGVVDGIEVVGIEAVVDQLLVGIGVEQVVGTAGVVDGIEVVGIEVVGMQAGQVVENEVVSVPGQVVGMGLGLG